MPTRSEIDGIRRASSSACSTPTTPVMPWYDGATSPRRRASSASAVLPVTGGVRVCGIASAADPTVTTASQPSASATSTIGVDVGLPEQVRLDADQADDVAVVGVALEDELVARPDDLADVVVDRDVRSLLGEVVERIGVDRRRP